MFVLEGMVGCLNTHGVLVLRTRTCRWPEVPKGLSPKA